MHWFAWRALVLSLFLLPAIGNSQSTPPSTVAPKSAPSSAGTAAPGSPAPPSPAMTDSAQESVVIEKSLMKVAYDADGTGTREQTIAVRVQSQAGVQALGVLTFAYLSSNESVEFDYIRVRKPDGTVVNTPDYNVQDMPAEVTRVAPMYSDIHEKHVTVKGLGVGDVLEYSVRYRAFKPQISGQFWWQYSFDKHFIFLDSELQLTVPKDKYLKLLSPDYKPEVKDDGAHRTYFWKSSNLKHKDPDEPVSREASTPDVQFSTFRSWQEIGSWYNELQKPQLAVTPQLKAKAAELTKGLASDEDKARAIYNYVATRFHYVSLSFGVGRYQPHPAEDVLENEYGDCKDKHTLLASLLQAAGIQAWPALINAERKLDLDMPSPGQFNHVITYVPRPSGALWLDTTPEVAPFGMLIVTLRDKQALVIPDSKPAELLTTPANPPFPVRQTFDIEGAIDSDGTLKAHVKQTVRGDQEVLVRLAFRATAPAQWKDLAQKISNGEGFGGEVSNLTVSPPEDTVTPFEFSYDYTRKNYSDWENHRMIAPLPVTGLEGASVQEKKPADPVLLGGVGEVVYTANIKLPVDIEKLPTDVSLKEPYAEYDSSYSAMGDMLITKRRLRVKQNEVPLASWDNYKKFSKALSDDWSGYTELYAAAGEANNSDDAGAAAANSTASSTKAPPAEVMEKWKEADAAARRGDTTKAEDILRELLKKYPDQSGLHGALGAVFAMRGDKNSAISEFFKEEELHPDLTQAYQTLARYYLSLRRDEEAAQQYRLWIQHDPKNYDPYSGLSGMLYKQKKYPEMLQLWQSAAKQMPESDHVKRTLGYAYLNNKQIDNGLPLVEHSLKEETDPMGFNDAAYMLADQNVQLEEAKEWGEKALRMLNEQSLSPMSESDALTNTEYLGMTWDTVGWVYFQMGDYDTAERYLHSSFALSQSATSGDHLAQTYQKQGKKQLAARTYKLAYAGTDASGNLKDEIMDRYNALMGTQADVAMLAPTHNKNGTVTPGPAEELSRLRTFHLSLQGAHKGSATFSLIFSAGKIEDVEYVGGDEQLKPLAKQIAATSIRAEFPGSVPARLTRRGLLVCSTTTSCEFALLLPDTPYSTQSTP